MQSSAWASRGTSTVDAIRAAASRTVPAAVSQECSGWGERKKTSAARLVWLSPRSANHCSHWTHWWFK